MGNPKADTHHCAGVQPPSAAECAAAHDSEAERAAARLSALQLRQRRLWESPDAAIDMAGGPDSANHPDAGSPTEISTSQESVPPPPCHGPICAGATVNPRVNRTHNRSPPCAGGTPTPGVCQAAAPRPHQAATGSQSRDAAGVAETLPPKQPSLEHSRPASSGGSAQQPQHPVQEDSQMPPASDPPVQPTRSEGAAAPLEVSEAVPMLQALPKPEVPSSELPSAPIAPAVGAVTTAAGSSGLQLGAQETQSPSCTSAKPAADVSLGGLAQYLGANAAPTAADTAPSQSDQRLTGETHTQQPFRYQGAATWQEVYNGGARGVPQASRMTDRCTLMGRVACDVPPPLPRFRKPLIVRHNRCTSPRGLPL